MSENYDTLVLSGGSSKGLVILGALQYGYDNYLLNEIETYIGTSAGAITCFLLAIGYSPLEIISYIKSMDDRNKKAYKIAFNHLGTSFNICKSNGYKEWKKAQNK